MNSRLPDKVIFFDGYCVACNKMVDFLLDKDSVGSLDGNEGLTRAFSPEDLVNIRAVVENGTPTIITPPAPGSTGPVLPLPRKQGPTGTWVSDPALGSSVDTKLGGTTAPPSGSGSSGAKQGGKSGFSLEASPGDTRIIEPPTFKQRDLDSPSAGTDTVVLPR
jgi:hypothetical protein